MSLAASRHESEPDLVATSREATGAVEALLGDATIAVRGRVVRDGKVSNRLVDREQRAAHGLAWLATYVQAVRQLAAYAERMRDAGRLGEIVRPADVGLSAVAVAARVSEAVDSLIASGNTAKTRAAR